MNKGAAKALVLWGFQGAECALVAARENQVYRVQLEGRSYALRLHRPGYRSDIELWSELQWMAGLADHGLRVPAPVASTRGNDLEIIEGVQVDVLTWVPGRPLGATATGIEHDDRTGVFFAIGQEMARLHSIGDDWQRPKGFQRWSWDRNGLVGPDPVWGRFWENPTLDKDDRALFACFRKQAGHDLKRIEPELDYGLIHADLVRENVIIDADQVGLIDFDDAGFGFRLFDIATTLIKNLDEADHDQLQSALLAGYRSRRRIDTEQMDLFIALRAATYVGWIVPRLSEDGSEIRNRRFVDTARQLLTRYLE